MYRLSKFSARSYLDVIKVITAFFGTWNLDLAAFLQKNSVIPVRHLPIPGDEAERFSYLLPLSIISKIIQYHTKNEEETETTSMKLNKNKTWALWDVIQSLSNFEA